MPNNFLLNHRWKEPCFASKSPFKHIRYLTCRMAYYWQIRVLIKTKPSNASKGNVCFKLENNYPTDEN